MRDKLAEKLFATVMGQDVDGTDYLLDYAAPLQALASHKYDEYGGFRPGVKFMESLAAWLHQLESAERLTALDFVRDRLVFVSNAELDHALSVAYHDLVRPRLLARAAAEARQPEWRVARVASCQQFRDLERQVLVLGLADGARLDKFRRANPSLVHDQFAATVLLEQTTAQELAGKLAAAVDPCTGFRHVLLVDDFSGSGFTMLRPDGEGWGGKLAKFHAHLAKLKEWGVVASDVEVSIVLYVASETAEAALRARLAKAGWGWELDVVQVIPDEVRLEDGDPFAELSRKYHDPVLDDKVKLQAGTTAALGFGDPPGRLPLVLPHNTPNNSVSLLWGHTASGYPGSTLRRRALFPRFERHREDRP